MWLSRFERESSGLESDIIKPSYTITPHYPTLTLNCFDIQLQFGFHKYLDCLYKYNKIIDNIQIHDSQKTLSNYSKRVFNKE